MYIYIYIYIYIRAKTLKPGGLVVLLKSRARQKVGTDAFDSPVSRLPPIHKVYEP